ncbi:hypothetical protein DS891_20890 [Pseudoalteromonas sp. JC28]|nr:hypothetical protein [Pseudoalteromonas sp. JC28]
MRRDCCNDRGVNPFYQQYKISVGAALRGEIVEMIAGKPAPTNNTKPLWEPLYAAILSYIYVNTYQ